MSDMNCVNLTGRLGADPEIRYTTGNTAVGNFSLAVSRYSKDRETGERKERTTWVRCVLFDKRAEVARDYLKKGSRVAVAGHLHESVWTGRDGNENRRIEVRVDELVLVEPKREAAGDDAPPRRNMRPGPPTGRQGPATPPPGEEEFNDDIPF